MKRLLRMGAPYFAVCIFWVGLHQGWLALLAYHVQIVCWAERPWPRPLWPRARIWGWAAPAWLAGPLVLAILPHVGAAPLDGWLADHGLRGTSLLALVPWFGIVHPVLEQWHWSALRRESRWAHVAFAGYHLVVLWALLAPVWLAVAFGLLVATSVVWAMLERRTRSLALPALTHVFADLGLVALAWATTRG